MQRSLSLMVLLFVTVFMAACSKSSTLIPTRPRFQVQQTQDPFQGVNYTYCERCLHFFTPNHKKRENRYARK